MMSQSVNYANGPLLQNKNSVNIRSISPQSRMPYDIKDREYAESQRDQNHIESGMGAKIKNEKTVENKFGSGIRNESATEVGIEGETNIEIDIDRYKKINSSTSVLPELRALTRHMDKLIYA
ncbi:hypothetical protein EVAR_20466_1 [Eumeta japonica]|uniref:Uncharacterized protein n=1 Tax=Eumeta variegata TaxID=151549 RepID=A0A4C1TYN6_EUMVA|nr:hypothetical protein EVAR_20466_1 [Eumeta japonica]